MKRFVADLLVFLILALLMTLGATAHAEDTAAPEPLPGSTVAPPAKWKSKALINEIQLAPYFGYSTYSGPYLGGDMSLFWRLSDQFQLQTGISGGWARAWTSNTSYQLGLVYNFGEDLRDSWFVGGGARYAEWSKSIGYGEVAWNYQWSPYARVGKKFLMSDKYDISYAPAIEYGTTAGDSVYFKADLLNFSMGF